jgi:hypothetical protein
VGWLLAASAFGGAALAFVVEPIVAKMLLPAYGGSAAVWTTALVFFQTALVAGYAWAHASLTRLGVRRHALLQIGAVVIGLAALPVTLPSWAVPPTNVPSGLWLTAALAVMVGLPFFVLCTNGPTVQRWFADAGGTGGREPYRLFAASNAGSLIGLLAYPTLVEPNLDLDDQARWWAAGFAAFAVLTAIAALRVRAAGRVPRPGVAGDDDRLPARASAEPTIGRQRRVRWLVLAAVPAALMVGVTSHLSTDVAAVPFLWVVPLAIYLVTMILAFARPTPILAGVARTVLPVMGVVATIAFLGWFDIPIATSFAIHLGTLLVAGTALHGALAADRPPPVRLTEYTLLIALGGALGGLVAGILGPLVLPVPLEAQIALVAALIVALPGAGTAAQTRPGRPFRNRWAALVVPVGTAAALAAGVVAAPPALATARSFYGAYRVVDDGHGRHVLYAGTTIHGIQDMTPGQEGEPWSYYSRAGPLGQVLTSLTAEPSRLRIGAVGLGTGAIAAYGRQGDRIEFLEIDPAVVAIAGDPRLFTYLVDSKATVTVAIGDGRLLLEAREAAAYDLLVLDAFSSDAVPVHLLTIEGLGLAMSRVRDGGVVALHVSNRYLDLEPIVAAAARDLGFVAILGATLTPASELGRAQASQWVVIGRSYRDVAGLVSSSDWRTAHAADRAPWTDRFSDLLGVLRRD